MPISRPILLLNTNAKHDHFTPYGCSDPRDPRQSQKVEIANEQRSLFGDEGVWVCMSEGTGVNVDHGAFGG